MRSDHYHYMYDADPDNLTTGIESPITRVGLRGIGLLSWWRNNSLCEDGLDSVSGNPNARYRLVMEPGNSVAAVNVSTGTYEPGQTYDYIPCQVGQDCHDCGFRPGINTVNTTQRRRRRLEENQKILPPPWNDAFINDLIALKAAGASMHLPPVYTTLMRIHGIHSIDENRSHFDEVYEEEVALATHQMLYG